LATGLLGAIQSTSLGEQVPSNLLKITMHDVEKIGRKGGNNLKLKIGNVTDGLQVVLKH